MKNIEPDKIFQHLDLRNGIWYAQSGATLSYPDYGNEASFQVEENSFWFRHRNNCILALIKRFPPNGLFFDIGGGNGYVAKAIEEAGFETVLLEPGETGAVNAQKRGLKNIVCATLEQMALPDNSIPAAGLFDVVEHIEDDLTFLRKLHTILQKDGRLYLTVPAYQALWSNQDKSSGHYRRYTIKSMSRLLTASGYKIEYATYIFSILPFPVFFFRTFPSLIGLDKKPKEQKKRAKEHSDKKGIAGELLQKIWDWEIRQIAKGKSIGMGGSCLVVARKV